MKKMYKLLLIVFLIPTLYGSIYGQTKIYLIRTKPFGAYKFVNERDTSVIYTGHCCEDMGVHYGHFYKFKETGKIPNGKYEVYIDGKIDLSGYFKNNLKDKTWTSYQYDSRTDSIFYIRTTQFRNGEKHGEEKLTDSDGSWEIRNYTNGKLEGKYIGYFPSGKVKYKGYNLREMVRITTMFDENGQMSKREYATYGNRLFREEFFEGERKVKIKSSYDHRSFEKYEKELNGKRNFPFPEGKCEVTFKSNKIKKVKIFDKNKLLFVSKKYEELK